MILGKLITTTWQDALAMLSECKVARHELVPPGELQLVMRDPAGQEFVLRVAGAASIGVNGNIVVLNAALQIACHEVKP